MRVLHIEGFPGVGGTVVATRRIVDNLLPLGVRSSVLLLRPTESQTAYFKDAGIPYMTGLQRPEPSFARELPAFLRDSWAIARICKSYDIIHCIDVTAAYHAAFAGWLARRPVICHIRTPPVTLPRRRRIFVNLASHFIFVSLDARRHFPMKLPDTMASVIYDGITTQNISCEERAAAASEVRAEFNLPADTTIVGMFARVYPPKDYATLIQAAAILRGECPRLRFLIVGDNAEIPVLVEHFRKVQGLAATAGVSDRFIFTGYRTDVQRLMLGVDVCALCTNHEGFGLVVMEAMALGRPCIATAVGGVPEIITNGRTGLLHANGDASDLAAGIMRLINDQAFAMQLGLNARDEVVRRFNQDRCAKDVRNLYERLIPERLKARETYMEQQKSSPEIDVAALVAQLREALSQLEPPFLALPERGETTETLAYQRGARDAYQAVLDALK